MAIDEMDTFFDNMQILLPTMGFSLFGSKSYKTESIMEKKIVNQNFTLNVGGIKATVKLNSDSFEVLPDSQATTKPADSLSDGYKNIRNTWINRGILVEDGNKLKFVESYEFSSASAAAAIILGYPVNGRTAWKTISGKTLKEYEESLLNKIITDE